MTTTLTTFRVPDAARRYRAGDLAFDNGEHGDSVFVGILPNPVSAEALAVGGDTYGYGLDRLHCTVAYLGSVDEVVEGGHDPMLANEAVSTAIRQLVDDGTVGENSPPVAADVAGTGWLGSDDCYVAFVQGDVLSAVARRVRDVLREFFPVEMVDRHPEWIPHITIAELPGELDGEAAEVRSNIDALQGSTVEFDRLVVAVGADIREYEIRPADEVPVQEEPEMAPTLTEDQHATIAALADTLAQLLEGPSTEAAMVGEVDIDTWVEWGEMAAGRAGQVVAVVTEPAEDDALPPLYDPADVDEISGDAPLYVVAVWARGDDGSWSLTDETMAFRADPLIVLDGPLDEVQPADGDVDGEDGVPDDGDGDPDPGSPPPDPGAVSIQSLTERARAAGLAVDEPEATVGVTGTTQLLPVVELVGSDGDADVEVEGHGQVEFSAATGRFRSLLIIEGEETGDGRYIEEGALTWRDLPLPLMFQFKNPDGGIGHDAAVNVGRIDEIVRQGREIWGFGVLDVESERGREAMRLIKDRFVYGVSVDMDAVDADYVEGDDRWIFHEGRIMGATGTPFPAMPGAFVEMVEDDQVQAIAASAGVVPAGGVFRLQTVVASMGSIPAVPPADWFDAIEFDQLVRWQVTDEGRIFGHVAPWNGCHIGFKDCRPPPRMHAPYDLTLHDSAGVPAVDLDGRSVRVRTATLVMDTVHPSLKLRASDAQAFYADTGSGIADVRLSDDEWGVQVNGALRPGVTPAQFRALCGSRISPDWREYRGGQRQHHRKLGCYAVLAVNAGGFRVEGSDDYALVASAGGDGDLSLIGHYENGRLVAQVGVDWSRAGDCDGERDLAAEMDQLTRLVAAAVDELTTSRRRDASEALGRLTDRLGPLPDRAAERQRVFDRFGIRSRGDDARALLARATRSEAVAP